MSDLKSVIVIGASAGGLQAISSVLKNIRPDLDATILVVLHVARSSNGSILVHHLQKQTPFTCKIAEDGEIIKNKHVYIARPDFQTLVTAEVIRVIKGPHENRWRPSIDVLFRSAAAAFNAKTIGIILTGLLDDGTAGMLAIKRCGGICIVQEPEEAEFADMPISVLNHVDVDYRVPISDIGYILDDMSTKPASPDAQVPEDIRIEAALTEKMISDIDELKKIGTRSDYTCPDCGGSLFLMNNDTAHRYRCFTGHVYTEKLLLDKQSESLEESLWVSLRKLEERKNLLQTTAKHQHQLNHPDLEAEKTAKAEEMAAHIERLKTLLVSLGETAPNSIGYE
ncbi:chemotaxis protein CheB [Mucilaginibacter sp.]|uniref:chemotaxis protein CheB n=1 Tax=Mucilaginibacter sp. TaxID=1882438 RepID=UPI003B003DCA